MHTYTHTQTQTHNMHVRVHVWATRERSLTCFLFLCAAKAARRNAISPAEADDRLEVTLDSVGSGEGGQGCKWISTSVRARRRPIMTCEFKFGFSSEAAQTHARTQQFW